MLNEEQKFLVRELRSYNYLIIKYANMTEAYANTLKYLDSKIIEIDEKLNEYHIPAIRYDSITSINNFVPKKNSRVVELLLEQERIIKRKENIYMDQVESINKIVTRIEDIDIMLCKLTKWERQFITHMYIESKCIEYMCDMYNYSKRNIYKKSEYILNKMIKK